MKWGKRGQWQPAIRVHPYMTCTNKGQFSEETLMKPARFLPTKLSVSCSPNFYRFFYDFYFTPTLSFVIFFSLKKGRFILETNH